MGAVAGAADDGAVRAVARIDHDALRANLARVRESAPTAGVMAVVKADAYGHGMTACAATLREAGVPWLAVAFVAEALTLRAAGDRGRLLALIVAPGDDLAAAVAGDVDLSAGSPSQLARIAAAAASVGRRARVHLELDTGLGRGGARADTWTALAEAAQRAAADGLVEVVGLWSHLARADEPEQASNDLQVAAFAAGVERFAALGVHPEVRHLANSAATLTRPDAHHDLVRPGIALYGLSPGPGLGTAAGLGLRPVMTLSAAVSLTKAVGAGQGISYGHRYLTREDTRVAVVPLGYGDGVPRHATNAARVLLGGRRHRVAGTVCMDQFVLDVGSAPVADGDTAVLFGPGDLGEPSADDWGAACGTIGYEIVTRVGPRVPREHVGAAPAAGSTATEVR